MGVKIGLFCHEFIGPRQQSCENKHSLLVIFFLYFHNANENFSTCLTCAGIFVSIRDSATFFIYWSLLTGPLKIKGVSHHSSTLMKPLPDFPSAVYLESEGKPAPYRNAPFCG